ncbi:MAG: response regulator [Lachnospiraceae bacterium]|nr:response regulator [Lachnospiraceae bacterium]
MVLKVLIVDDERLIVMGLKACIEKITDLECEVRVASSGRQALELLEVEPAHLMITDVEMLGLSGLELVEKAKQKGYCQHFMILSGYDKFEYARRALRLGVTDYLLKPIDKDELRKDICRIAREMEKEGELDLMQPYRVYFSHVEKEDIPPALHKSVRFIQEHYREGVSLSMLGEYMGKSENYLSGLFKKELNITFLELVNELRIRDVVYMLLYVKEIPICDIAGKVGYRTERQLFRLIKSSIGLTPQQIRDGVLPKIQTEQEVL